jgi:predicted N-formylglutamate amidohydrolase
VFGDHVAVDIGAGPLAEALAVALGCPAWMGAWSRLVCDVNRAPDDPSLIPEHSDTLAIPGNHALVPEARAARRSIHDWFHSGLDALVRRVRPRLIVSIHSFTPRLRSNPETARPWALGVLWNRDARAATQALAALDAIEGLPGPVGANEPYSGQVLNYTMNRHAEAAAIPYLGLEVRQDLLADAQAVDRWRDRLVPVIAAVRDAMP